jgi:hypothetical protein
MQLKFKSKKAHQTCYTYVDGHGFYFRNHPKNRVLEFCYEYTMKDVADACNLFLNLEGKYEVIIE